ncbi:MAG: hypothetical protein ACYS47_10435 [Planctomycetota bacterium]|jgi:hypothetical protein
MAKASSRRGRAPQPEEDYDEPMDDMGEAAGGESMMTALLIVAFGFIFLGIILAWWTLHKNFDTPFMGVMQKSANKKVKVQAEKDFAKAKGLEVAAADEDEGEYDEGDEDEGTDEEDTEEE